MDIRKVTCICAAGFLGLGFTATAPTAHAKKPVQVTVIAPDPQLQRRVSYADLNLAAQPDQRTLKRRIAITAGDLCFDLNVWNDGNCKSLAINSTRGQVQAAIARAERQMAGLSVGPPIAIGMVISVR